MRGGVYGRGVIPVRHLAIEGADRLADHVDDRIPNTSDLGTAGTLKAGELAIDRQDLVPIMAAIEGRAPDLTATHGAAVGDGEIESLVAHLADVLNCRADRARGRGGPGVEEQIVGGPRIQVNREIAAAVQELEVETNVTGLVLFPLQVRVPRRDLPESGYDARSRSTDVVERVPRAAAERGDDPATPKNESRRSKNPVVLTVLLDAEPRPSWM